MLEGMTSIDLGTSPIQETTRDINNTPDENIETAEERLVIKIIEKMKRKDKLREREREREGRNHDEIMK